MNNPALHTEWNPIDLARLAAYIDGEGYIRIRGKRSHHTDHIDLSVCNTDYKLHLWLKGTFGGRIEISDSGKGKYKKCWKWRAGIKLSYVLLKASLPYFIMKREQAEIAIGFHELVQAHSGNNDSEQRSNLKNKLIIVRQSTGERMAS